MCQDKRSCENASCVGDIIEERVESVVLYIEDVINIT